LTIVKKTDACLRKLLAGPEVQQSQASAVKLLTEPVDVNSEQAELGHTVALVQLEEVKALTECEVLAWDWCWTGIWSEKVLVW